MADERSKPLPVIVGVDVGGTNTDAVVISVRNAVLSVLRRAKQNQGPITVTQVNIGTTHFVNAVVQHKGLNRVSVIRLCGPASVAIAPFSDFPPALKSVIFGSTHFVSGGYRVDGREIEQVDPEEIREVVDKVKAQGVTGIVVCGIFAPTRPDQEEQVKKLIKQFYPEASVTLSHTIGHIGLLERENAAILNECLKKLCEKTVSGFRRALEEIGTSCPIFLTQNDGTVISAQQAMDAPVFTLASGPTNSMRGAAFLCNVKDAIVVDIGGTSTDVGVLKNRFPREASTDVRISGVRTNFRMPDVHSVGLGGGSYVTNSEAGGVAVGPLSAGYNLKNESFVFGTPEANRDPTSGRWLTATDVAVAAGLMDLGDKDLVQHLTADEVMAAVQKIKAIVEDAIDSVRVSDEPLPVILVGGGSKLLDQSQNMKGVSEILLPEHYGVANAIGAALSQVSGNIDSVVVLERMLDAQAMEGKVEEAKKRLGPDARQKDVDDAVRMARKPFLQEARVRAIAQKCDDAREMAIKAGAAPGSLVIVEQEEVGLSYLPGSATRIKIKAVGNLADPEGTEARLTTTAWTEPPGLPDPDDEAVTSLLTKQTTSVTGHSLTSEADPNAGVTWADLTPSRPHVDGAGEWIVSEWDVECMAVGAGILGGGGGGNPNVARVRAREAVKQGQKLRIVSPEKLLRQADLERDLVITVGFMGAPVVLYEQTTSGHETTDAFRCLQEVYSIGGYADGRLHNTDGVEIKVKDGVTFIDDYQPPRPASASAALPAKGGDAEGDDVDVGTKRVVGVLCGEAGGMNSLEPLMVSGKMGLPTLDADGMGRAFPELQMFLPFIHGMEPFPSALADDKGRRAVILHSQNARQVEDHFRQVAMEMGSASGLAFAPVRLADVMTTTVIRSFSRIWRIGDSILRARRNKESPLDALLDVESAKVLVVGKIRDVTRETSGAFNRGRVDVEGVAYKSQGSEGAGPSDQELLKLVLDFQNENLVVRRLDQKGVSVETLAVVPDIITIVDAETAEPIPTEEVRYGQRVAVVVLPVPPPMATPRALEVVGPVPFGYPEVRYVPLGGYREPEPLAPCVPVSV
nr:hypothetical protein BaRGS_033437 [Batillaria attramentaria]